MRGAIRHEHADGALNSRYSGSRIRVYHIFVAWNNSFMFDFVDIPQNALAPSNHRKK
jgi:hypothetical protein